LLILVSLAAQGRAGTLQGPANAEANPRAKAILAYFQNLEARPDKRLVSGQFSDFGNRASAGAMGRVQEKTGQWPAILGVDYADFARGGLTCVAPNREAIAYWKAGGLVTVSAHLYNPANKNGGGLRDMGMDLSTLLQPDSETHRRWVQEMDDLAAGLRELKAAGVVVLWRPFHEMNGDWFWWGAQPTNTFIEVWRNMFDYFTRTKGLDNLLWVYSPNHGRRTTGYYPGDRYVDLVGLDAYTDFLDPKHIQGYAEVARLPKPFGFTEYGPHGANNPPGDYDYRQFIEGVQQNFPRTVFFMCWNANWSLSSNSHTKEMLSHSWIVNRGDLPPDLAGAGGASN
jgi:mannan endo-1,4-beta-mannosidase